MIDLGLRSEHLYLAVRLTVTFALPDGSSKFGHGTGFFVVNDQQHIHLITARHCLDPKMGNYRGATFESVQVDGFNDDAHIEQGSKFRVTMTRSPKFPDSDDLDVAAILLDRTAQFQGSDFKCYTKIEDLAPAKQFQGNIRAGDFIATAGHVTIQGLETESPLMLTGIVASDPRRPAVITRKNSTVEAVLYQSLSRSGMSGAPVFATQRGLILGDGLTGPPSRRMWIAGVNGGHFEESSGLPLQFSYFTRSDAVIDLINS